MARYNVVSFDNSRSGREGFRADRGEFDSGEAAVTHAKQLVDQALQQLGVASSAHELMTRYTRWGSEVPMVHGEPRMHFHAYQYAREKANSMFVAAT